MSKELVIDFQPGGSVQTMHMDGFDLSSLGSREIRRQTEIKFDPQAQHWVIIYIDEDGVEHRDDALNGFSGYEVARTAEVDWINDCRLSGTLPMSDEGLALMQANRRVRGS